MRLLIFLIMLFWAFNAGAQTRKSSYVKSYVTRSGKLVKGHYRSGVSTKPNAAKSRAYSRSYYQRKGKYTRRR